MMANCTNCGAPLNGGEQFCVTCGARVADTGGVTPPPQAGVQPPTPPQQPQAGATQPPPAPPYPQGQYQAPPQGQYQAPPQGQYQAPPQGQYQAPPPGGYQPPPGQYQPPYQQPLTPEQDIASNKGMAVLAYFGIFMLIPLLSARSKNSPYVRYHCNQGLIMLILSVGWGVVYGIIQGILQGVLLYTFGWYGLYAVVTGVLGLVSLGIGVLDIIGIVNAATGKMKPVPLVGGFTILK